MPFPIVGIGASAGGYEAFSQLLAALPSDTGMAYVLIQHLDPTHPSLLTSMLSKATAMRVLEIEHGMRPAPNHVYVMPSGSDVGLAAGAFSLVPREKVSRPHLPIDAFFQALARERMEQGIGVILSGTGSDGTAGLQAIKTEGGVTIVQDPGSAKFGGMPESALAAGIVDLSLGIPEIAAELARLAHHAYLRRPDVADAVPATDAADLERIFALVRTGIGVDLSEYKEASIRRRLGRRMALKRVETFAQYATFVREHPGEDRALFEDILIHVTSFFRDAETFETLKTHVFPEIVKRKQPDDSIRIWVTGCSTGQEAYSVAIALLEFLGDGHPGRRIQVFGSDISEAAIEKARAGVYPDSVASDISPERLRRFFSKVEGGYAISKAVREVCVFVRHDLARDPAFSHLDLITCRNVLIYFNPELQRRVLGTFHYSLNLPGVLLLGRAENTLGLEDLFSPLDAAHKIFARNAGMGGVRFAGVRGPLGRRRDAPVGSGVRDRDAPEVDVTRQVDTQLLAQYAPPGVLINERMEVLQFRGHTGPYFEPPAGQPQLNVLKMARPELLSDLRIALARAMRDSVAVRREGIVVTRDGVARTCALVVAPVTGLPETERLFTVLFEDASAARGRRKPEPRAVKGRVSPERVAMLEEDLAATKDYLESIIGDHQKTNDALAAANEELASGNEELQSVNEELETAKEELQSSNEELTTLNDELHDRNQELGQLNSDLGNVINSVEIPLVMLDAERRIRWVTPGARTIMNMLPSDIGRSVELIRPMIAIEKIRELVTAVMRTGAMSEVEVEDVNGRWYRLQVRPYKAPNDKLDGTVISLVDIDVLRRAIGDAEWARDYAAGVVEAVGTPLVVLDAALAVMSANRAFYEFFDLAAEQVVGRPLLPLGELEISAPHLQQALSDIVNSRDHAGRILVETTVPRLGARKLVLTARPVRSPKRHTMILLSLEDETDRVHQEAKQTTMLRSAQAAELRAEDANSAKDRFLAVVSHELRTPLSSLLLHVELLRRMQHADPAIARVTEGIERASKTQARLIDDLLDVSRISTGKLEMDRRIMRLAEVVHDAVDLVRPMANQKSIVLQVALADALPPLFGDAARLRQVFWNLLANAIKFTPEKGFVTVTADASDGFAQVTVRDTGVGIEPQFQRLLFQPFAQMHEDNARVHGGLGLGLAIVRQVVGLHGGSVRAESAGAGRGAAFTVVLPVISRGESVTVPGVVPDAAPNAGETAPRPELALQGLRVLLAEDDDGTREPLVAMLADRGADVRGACSAAEAMKVFLEFKPQVVVSDVGMPGEDGYSLLRRIRKLSDEEGGQTPALALTAFARAEDRRKAMEAGFDVHAAKPIEFERLASTLLELSRVGAERTQKQWSDR